MKIIRSSPRFTYVLLTVLLALCTYGTAIQVQKGTSSLSVWISIICAYGLLFFLYVYTQSIKIVLHPDRLQYETLFERHELSLEDLHTVEFQYMHQNVQTMFPVLHLAAAEKRIEIPIMLFERDLQQLHDWLIQKSRP